MARNSNHHTLIAALPIAKEPRFSMDKHKFAICYFKGDTLVAADAVNSQKEFMACRKLVGQEVSVDTLRETFGGK